MKNIRELKSVVFLSLSLLFASPAPAFSETDSTSNRTYNSHSASDYSSLDQRGHRQVKLNDLQKFSRQPFQWASKKSVKQTQISRKKHVIQSSKFNTHNVRSMRPLYVKTGNPVDVNGTVTSLTSTSDKMISYRHQYHLWETTDNGLHVLLNQGNNASGTSLILYSSFDDGQTWNTGLTLPNTNENVTADGFFKDNKLYITFNNSSGNVVFSTLSYNTTTHLWSTLSSNTIFTRQQGLVGTNPSFAIDTHGVFWSTFVTASGAGTNVSVSMRLYRSDNQGQNWTDTGIKFGNTSNSFKRSARLMALGDRLGVIYTNNTVNSTNIFWAYRLNNADTTTPWQTQLVFQSSSVDADPYGSHFNAVADAQQNIHLASRAGGRLIYLKYKAQNQTWDIPRYLTSYQAVAFANVTIATDNRVFIIYNSSVPDLSVLESSDGGATFANSYFLEKPDLTGIGTVANFTTPRMITSQPLLGSSRLPIFRQFVLDNVQRLSLYNINIQGN